MNQVDPFLHLVEDWKLQAVNTGPDHPGNVYGSKEDDTSASKSLSEMEFTNDQTREFLVSEILNSLDNLSEVKLLYELLPSTVKELVILLSSPIIKFSIFGSLNCPQ